MMNGELRPERLRFYFIRWRRWIATALDSPNEIGEWQLSTPFAAQTYHAGARSVVVSHSGVRFEFHAVIPAEPRTMILSAYGVARSTIQDKPLSDEGLRKIHVYWRACNYLSLGLIYLQDNPLLRAHLKPEHIKNQLLGHWGASRGLAFTLA